MINFTTTVWWSEAGVYIYIVSGCTHTSPLPSSCLLPERILHYCLLFLRRGQNPQGTSAFPQSPMASTIVKNTYVMTSTLTMKVSAAVDEGNLYWGFWVQVCVHISCVSGCWHCCCPPPRGCMCWRKFSFKVRGSGM